MDTRVVLQALDQSLWWHILAILNKVINVEALVHSRPVAISPIRELPLTILHELLDVVGVLSITAAAIAASGVEHLGAVIRIIDIWSLNIIEISILSHPNRDVASLGSCSLGD